MGLTQGDYWSAGVDLPCPELVAGLVAQLTKYHPGSRAAKDTAELLAVLTRACELADALACVSVGYGYDLGNNLDGSGPSTTHAVREYEKGATRGGQYLPSDSAAAGKSSTVDVLREREALNWQTVARAVRVVDAQSRPGPGMADDDVLDAVLRTVFEYAKDKRAARLATAYPDGRPPKS